MESFITSIEVTIKPDLDSNEYSLFLEWDEHKVNLSSRGPLDQALIHMQPHQLVRLGRLMATLGEFWGEA